MDLKPVLYSSNITAVGYDTLSHTLAVCFRDGLIYYHAEVPQVEYDSFMEAESLGAHYRKVIRGRYIRWKV